MTAVEFAIRLLAQLSLCIWLGSLVYLILAAVILERHAGPKAGDLIGRCLDVMSKVSYAAMLFPAAWTVWDLAQSTDAAAWSRVALFGVIVALALATGLWAIPIAARERRERNEYRGQSPNPHIATFNRLHRRAVWLESLVAGALVLLVAIETWDAM